MYFSTTSEVKPSQNHSKMTLIAKYLVNQIHVGFSQEAHTHCPLSFLTVKKQ